LVTHVLLDTSHTYPAAQALESAHVDAQVPSLPHKYALQGVELPSLSIERDRSGLHVAPCRQWLDFVSQVKPFAQSALVVQLVAHALLSQVYGTHDDGVAARHLPAPSQVDAPMV
jgi:hypothetical protein